MYRKLDKILAVVIPLVVIFLSIGYSILNKELSVTGDLIYRAKADIRITNVRLDSVNSTVESFSPNFSKDEVILGFNMENDTSTITYKIEVTNYSDVEMGILKIEGLPTTYEIKDYTLKTKLIDTKGNSKTGMVKEFSIVLKADATFKGIQSIRLKLDFEPIYTITYSGFNDDTNYLKEIIKGENFSQNLDDSVDDILVTMNNISTNNYTFNNKKLEIQNVDGNILIENNTPNVPVLNGDMIPVYYDEQEAVWRKADINNIDNNWYDYKTQKWANAVTVVEESVKDLSGNYNRGIVHGAKVENGEAYFDGVDDFVDCGLENYDFGQDFTVQITFKINQFVEGKTYNSNSILGNQEDAGFDFQIMAKLMRFQIYNGEKYESFDFQNYDLNTWYTITFAFNKNRLKVYVEENGQTTIYTKELEQEISVKKSPMPFILGGNPNSNGKTSSEANVTISKLLLYDCCLSDDEISSNTQNNDSLLINLDFNKLYHRDTYKNFDIIPMREINTMWVWIPRYSYTIKKENGSSDYYGKQEAGRTTTPTKALPGEIDVKFINNTISEKGTAQYIGNAITNWHTNESFNFDDTNNHGIWYGKFEVSGTTEECSREDCDISNIVIKPNVKSLVKKSVSNFFFIARSMQNDNKSFGFSTTNGNIHMQKDSEWGAVAYLSQSRYGKYGNKDYTGANKEVYQNKSSGFITGSSNGTPGQSSSTTPQYLYNDMSNNGVGTGQAGPGASTTGNIYGIYDMSGGNHEYTMSVITYSSSDELPMSGYTEENNSGFTGKLTDGTEFKGIDFFNKNNSKYYNQYKTLNPSSDNASQSKNACNNGICYGYGLSETNNWYSDASSFVNISHPWSSRGGYITSTSTAGIFYYTGNNDNIRGGGNSAGNASRFTITI